jgi:hypothetical protein
MLHPFDGRMRRYRFGPTEEPGSGISRRVLDGAKTYSFNSLGYRGEEFDPDSPVKLFVCGCSYTFGDGLELEESWPFLFKERLAKQHGLPASSVNLMNFSEGGASNDYITRILITQSARVRPDMMVAAFTNMRRFELIDETVAFPFGSWGMDVYLEKYSQTGHAHMAKNGEFVFLGTDENQEKLRMIKNVLLLQYFCRSRDIPFIFLFMESLVRNDLPSALSIPTTQPLYEEIDLDLLVPIERAMKVDLAADEIHPGPRSQELMAEAAWKTYRARYAESM